MNLTELFLKTGVRDVYIATDNLQNVAELSQCEDAAGFRLHSIMQIGRVSGAGRYSPEATEEFLAELKLLTHSLVTFCTASSAVGSTAYYMRTVHQPLLTDNTFSLDVLFRFTITTSRTYYRIIDGTYILQQPPSDDPQSWTIMDTYQDLEQFTEDTQLEGRPRDWRSNSVAAGFLQLEMRSDRSMIYVPNFAFRKRNSTF